MFRRCFSLFVFMLPWLLYAQWQPGFDAVDDTVKKWDFHVSLGTAVSTGNGRTVAYLGVAPSVEYRPNDRFTLRAGFSALNSTDPSRFLLEGKAPCSRTPRKNSSLALSAYVEGSYWVSDRLCLSAAFFHQGGQMLLPGGLSWWGWAPNGMPVELDRTGFAAELRYRIGDDTYFNLYLSVVRNRGAWPYPAFDGYGFRPWYGSAFDHCGSSFMPPFGY